MLSFNFKRKDAAPLPLAEWLIVLRLRRGNKGGLGVQYVTPAGTLFAGGFYFFFPWQPTDSGKGTVLSYALKPCLEAGF